MKTVRCAIYTRKSSDEGLEQGFNSLDAQREACAAYILSQASEGWVALPDIYDDGGISGAERSSGPALQRLLAEVREGRIDIIVVYKVDRLTRSLLDFSKLVEAFDKAGTSFVSITQSFNTTTSMGRLTLNMLLSFAQFEREVTAERIRDKIAASKAKGMWMGGTPPLGYEPDGRSLKIVEPHAALIRHIFERYLALGNVRTLAVEMGRDGNRIPRRTTKNGNPFGGGAFTRGHLYSILRNPLYIGKIAHRDLTYDGQHDGIIDPDLWQRVQAQLTQHRQGHGTRTRAERPSLLAGKVVDAAGERLLAVHATKGTTRYRYYVSKALQEGRSQDGWRVPARELEAVVAERLAQAFDDPLGLLTDANLPFHVDRLPELGRYGRAVAAAIRQRGHGPMTTLIHQVRIENGRVVLACDVEVIGGALVLTLPLDRPATIELVADVRLTRSGRAMRLIDGNGRTTEAVPNRSLISLLMQARAYWAELRKGELNITELAAREGVQDAYISRLLRLAFLAPVVVEAVIKGEQPASLSSSKVMLGFNPSPRWNNQAVQLLA